MSALLFFESTKDQGVGNELQVPADGIQVDIYRPGALVSKLTSYLPGTQSIQVYDSGAFEVGDVAALFDESLLPLGTVTDIPDREHIEIAFVGVGGSLALGQALVPVTARPDGFVTPSTVAGQEGALHGARNSVGSFNSSQRGIVASWVDRKDIWLTAVGGGTAWTGYKGYPVMPDSPGTDHTIVVDGTRYSLDAPGIQRAIDDVCTRGGGKVEIDYAGIVYLDAALSAHSGLWLQGRGPATVLMRKAGSIVDGGYFYSGSVIMTSPLGANGTLPTVGSPQENVTISDMTLDGNFSAFSGITDVNVGLMGLASRFTDGFYARNLRIRNMGQDGLNVVESRNVDLDNLEIASVGQWTTVSTRNGISLYNQSGAAGWSKAVSMRGIRMTDVGDEAIAGQGYSEVQCEGLRVDGCKAVFELAPTTAEVADWTVVDSIVLNAKNEFITLQGVAPAYGFQRMSFLGTRFMGHATLHDGSVLHLAPGANGSSVQDILLAHGTFRNINTLDLNNKQWIVAQPSSAATVTGIRLMDLSLHGKPGSVRNGDIGLYIRGACSDWNVSHVRLFDVPGVGVLVDDDVYVSTATGLRFDHVEVDGANHDGFQIVLAGSASRVEELTYDQCVAKDCCKVAGSNGTGFYHGIGITGAVIRKVTYNQCRSYKSSGTTHLYGLRTSISGTGDVNSIRDLTVNDCDFTGTQTAETLIGANTGAFYCNGFVQGFASLSGAGDQIPLPSRIAHCVISLNNSANLTLSSTPMVPAGGFYGQELTIRMDDLSGHTLQLADESGVANSGLRLTATPFVLSIRDSLKLQWDGSKWCELGRANVI